MYAVDDEITPVYPERKKKVLFDDRLDRQLRIQGWDQAALDGAKIGVVGDDDLLASKSESAAQLDVHGRILHPSCYG
jgi:hypothetical protein